MDQNNGVAGPVHQFHCEVKGMVLPKFHLWCLLYHRRRHHRRGVFSCGRRAGPLLMVMVFLLFCPAKTEGWEESSMMLSRLQDLPHSKDGENVSSPRDSVTSRYPCSALHVLYNAQIGSTNTFSTTKSCVFVRTTDTHLQRSALSPEEEGTISYRFSERHCHCSECKWAEELNRWLQWDTDSLQMVNSFPLRSVVGWMTAQYGCILQKLVLPPHTLLSWHFPLWKRQRDLER